MQNVSLEKSAFFSDDYDVKVADIEEGCDHQRGEKSVGYKKR